MARSNPIQIVWPAELEAQVRAMAKSRNMSFAAVVKEAVVEYYGLEKPTEVAS